MIALRLCYARLTEMETSDTIEQTLSAIRRAITVDYERDYFDLHQGRYRYILDKVIRLPIPRGARILDVGCYPPHLLTALQHLGYRVSGIASRHEPIKTANVVILNIERDRLPFPNRSFDLVLFSEVMEHLVVNPHVYLSEFHRVLTPHGRILITTPNAAGLNKLIPILLGRSTYFPLEQLFATKLADGSLYHRHNREFTMKELKEILERTDFVVNASEFFSAYKHTAQNRIVGNPIRATGRALAYTLMDIFSQRRDSLYVESHHSSETMTARSATI